MRTQVSVILPVYNAEEFLSEALQSVLDQTHSDFELLALDDGSIDASPDILNEFARRDSRIVAWRREHRGVGCTVNECLYRARNELVARFDADDVMLPSRLERQIWFMHQHPRVSVASSFAWLIDRRGVLLAEAKPIVDISRARKELKPRYFAELITPSTIGRKSHMLEVGGYPQRSRLEDRELWGRLVAAGRQLAVQPEFLLKQRIHRGSITGSAIYQGFVEGKYIDDNTVRLLKGDAPISFDEFLISRKQSPLLARFARYLGEQSVVRYRQATRDFAERDWLPFVMHTTGATLLNPRRAVRMLRRACSHSSSFNAPFGSS